MGADAGAVIVRTDRLLLRCWVPSDAERQRELWLERDPRVPPHRRVGPDGRPTVTDLEALIARDTPSPTLGLLAAVRRDSDVVIGYCGLLRNGHGQDGEPELAYEFLRASWGQGYATEAARAVVEWARASGHRRLWATVRVWNAGSRRVMARVGFTETSRIEPDAVHGDTLFFTRDLTRPVASVDDGGPYPRGARDTPVST